MLQLVSFTIVFTFALRRLRTRRKIEGAGSDGGGRDRKAEKRTELCTLQQFVADYIYYVVAVNYKYSFGEGVMYFFK